MKIPVLYQIGKLIQKTGYYFADLNDADNEFAAKLNEVIQQNLENCYEEGYRIIPDFNGEYEETKIELPDIKSGEVKSIRSLSKRIDAKKLNDVYQMLDDEYSKKLFVQLIAYRLLGHTRIRLPLSDKKFWLPMLELEKKCKQEKFLETKFWKLNYFDLTHIGYDIRLFFNTESIFIGLGLNEYGYNQNGIDFRVEDGDYVIDGGACYGDTALYFAHDVGEYGKVFSFEFLQSNLDVLNQNLELNPKLKDRITIFKNALWKNSKENLFTVENGPASFCTMKKPKNYSFKVKTKSIDDLVKSEEIPRVDFIKLDIEGAELEALKGCKNTIKKFKPKLAICLYHNAEHFVSLPKYIKKLVPEYNLYIDHHTMSEGETVMYAVPPQK